MKKKIMIVDDETQLVSLVKIRLEANNYDVVTAYGGEECLMKVKMDNPDLILLDILMPPPDGYETLRRLKEDLETRNIPVMMLTAKSQADDVEKAVEMGAVGYIVKPFSPVIFLEKVRDALGMGKKG